jgi:hypothetical protein
MMWNPPYVLPIAMVFGVFPYQVGRLLWFLLALAILVASADYFWRRYDGDQRRWLAWLVALIFYPSIALLQTGQIGAITLAGIFGFMYFEERQRDWLAGVWLVSALVKPHVTYLFVVVLLLWIMRYRRWKVFWGIAAGLAFTLGVAWLVNPLVFNQYVYAALNYPPLDWATPTLGGLLRMLFGNDVVWLQFVPSAIGLLWVVWFWLRHNTTWHWGEFLPPVMLVSVVSAAYGWSSDKVAFLMVPVLAAVWLFSTKSLRLRWFIGGIYVLINILAFIVQWKFRADDHQVWLGPAFLVWYVLFLLSRQWDRENGYKKSDSQ